MTGTHLYRPTRLGRGAIYPGRSASRQRRRLRPGDAILLDLKEGDLLSIENADGGSTAWLLPLDPSGDLQPGALGLTAPLGTPVVWSQFDAREISAWLGKRGRSKRDLTAISIFSSTAEAGERLTLSVSQDCALWMILPCDPSAVVTGGAGGRIAVEIQHAGEGARFLPDPLGDVREEFTVDRATGRAYQVAAGEVVQIIDVEGQQCSDFLAFRSASLEHGLERFIDSTVTRTLMAGAYPGPGLFDKFFDADMRPLLNVVQDTVGRHDTFALACTARGYEERGFPGHVNCSDNISAAMAPYGVAPRRAWPAINFFFNSWIRPEDNRLRSDEAWSRAGDYVALRAMSDLVCVSTACPDDVDPINAWNPTDIHVRIYKADQPLRRSLAYRAEPDSEAILTEESAFHPRTSALTRSFHVARDLWLPSSYEGTRALDEYWACRQAVTLQDMSALRKFDILGPDAEVLLQAAMTRDVAKLSVNRGFYGLLCDKTGALIDDGTLFRLTPEIFRWCCGSDESGRHLRALAEEMGLKVWIKSLFSAMPNLALQGPKSRELLRDLVFIQPHMPSLDTMKWFGCTVARLNDREGAPILLTRSGFTGELGYEIFCDRSNAVEVWDAVMAAGAAYGITPMGGEALDMIRIEAGLMIAGAEFGPDVDAFEAGLGFAVDLKKAAFVGKEALARNRDAQRRQLVGLLFEGNEVPSHGDGVFDGRRQIGVVTSATRSPSLERPIAMARLATEHAAAGTALEVGQLDGRMKRLTATTTSIPFIDPTRKRARA